MNLPWPGNVRQLENFLAQAVVLAERDMLTERDLCIPGFPPAAGTSSSTLQVEPDMLHKVERRSILRVLQRAQGNWTVAAKLLGISVRVLQYKLKAYAQANKERLGAETLQGDTATTRDWEPLRTNVSLGDPRARRWLMFIGAVLVLLVVTYLLV